MKSYLRAACATACSLLLIAPAAAQWQSHAGLGARYVSHAEYDEADHVLVRERGWLPGIVLGAAYRSGSLSWSGQADWYRADIGYRGQTQAGAAADSRTATGLATLRIGAAYALGHGVSLTAALEAERWQRDIRGTAIGAGLQERYRSERLILGGNRVWQGAAGLAGADLALLVATPERMRVGFSGLLDPVSLDTRYGRGLRLGASLRPAAAPALELRASYDWLRVGRSGAAAVTRNGQFAGTVAQPEHVRQGFKLTLSRLF